MPNGTPNKDVLDRFNLKNKENQLKRNQYRKKQIKQLRKKNNLNYLRQLNKTKKIIGPKRERFSPFDLKLPENTLFYNDKILKFNNKILTI